MKAVLGLIKDRLGVLFQCFFSDLFAAISRQTVEDQRLRGRLGNQRLVDLKSREFDEATGAFFFETHAHPDVGVENVRLISAGRRIVGHEDFLVGQLLQQRILRAIVLRGRDPELETKPFRRPDPGMRDVITSIANKTVPCNPCARASGE